MIPEFTSDEVKGKQEVVQPTETPTDEVVEEQEKETPSESPTEQKPDDTTVVDDTTEQSKAIQGLQEERTKLLREIATLRGQSRTLKQDEIRQVETKIDELKDVHPEDVQLIEKILRNKGYVRQDEVNKMYYKAVQDEELTKFLNKYPEYKPENDPSDQNWSALQRELGYYRLPENPRQVADILERAHKAIVKVPSGQNIPAQKRQLQVASAGAGGVQRSSSSKSLDPDKRAMLSRGGWSEEEIKKIEQNL